MPSEKFVALLSDISKDYLGELRDVGKSIEETQEKRKISQLMQEFLANKQELMTTNQAISDIKGMYENMIKKKQEGGEISPEDYASILLAEMQRNEALKNLITPYIQSLSILGERGVNLARALSTELANEIALSEKRMGIPTAMLELDRLKTAVNINKEELADIYYKKDRRDTVMKVASIMPDLPSFKLLAGVKVKSYDEATIKKYNMIVDNLIKEAQQKLGEGYTKTDILEGFKHANGMLGEDKFELYEKLDTSGLNTQQQMSLELQLFISELQRMSNWWNSASDELKSKFRSLVAQGTTEGLDEKIPEALKEFYDAFKPTGKYASYYSIVNALVPNFGTMKPDVRISGRPSSGKQEIITKRKKPAMYPDIIRITNFNSFVANVFDWNIKDYEGDIQKGRTNIEDIINQQSLFETTTFQGFNEGRQSPPPSMFKFYER